VIRRPVFEADAFRRHVQQTLSGLAISERDGAYLASREFERRIYGDHYLARATGGTSATVKRIRREDLIAFHKHYYRPNGSMLLFSGAVSNERAVAHALAGGAPISGKSPITLSDRFPRGYGISLSGR